MATVPLPSSAGAAVTIAMLLLAGGARADDLQKPARPDHVEGAPAAAPVTATRRGGFTLGVDAGFGAANITGYPNDVKKIGDPHWYTATGVRPTALVEAWVGGAIRDWFTFTLGVTSNFLFATGNNDARSLGGMFHVEAFPLFALGDHLRDLGLRIDAGLGTAMVADPAGTKLVDGSLASIFGGGVFYEGLRAWKTAHGPFLMANYLWSNTVGRPAIFLGWRSVLYTGP